MIRPESGFPRSNFIASVHSIDAVVKGRLPNTGITPVFSGML